MQHQGKIHGAKGQDRGRNAKDEDAARRSWGRCNTKDKSPTRRGWVQHAAKDNIAKNSAMQKRRLPSRQCNKSLWNILMKKLESS